MKHQKILHLLNEANDFEFVRRKWNIVSDNSRTNYEVGSKIIYNTEILKSNLCDYNNTYILVRANIAIIGHQVTQVACKNCAPFTKCITKIEGTTIDDAEQDVYGFIQKMKQLILLQILQTLLILNLSCIRLHYYKTQKLMEQMEL